MGRTFTWLLVVVCTVSALGWRISAQVGASQANDPRNRFRTPPKGWTVTESFMVPQAQLDGIGKKLEAQIASLSNTKLAVEGQQLKVNIFTCKTAADAAKVHESLLRIHQGKHMACPRDGLTIVEFVGNDPRLIERAYQDWGFKPPRVTYEVSFQATPITKCDNMVWNQMFNAWLAPQPNDMRIRELAKSFTFGDHVILRDHGLGSERSTFAFTPKAVKSISEPGGDSQKYTFADLPRKHGVPQVGVVATVTSQAYTITPTQRKPGPELLGPNEFWPSTDPQIVALAQQITRDKQSPRDKVAALLAWFEPNKGIKYGGPMMGSRYGVKKVLEQKTGRCWDFSDCFITLCRASGVPCQQVLGWMPGLGGHVWAEVLIEGEGWRQVDPTAGMGCDCRYVPYIVTETGQMSLAYTSAVVVREIPGKEK